MIIMVLSVESHYLKFFQIKREAEEEERKKREAEEEKARIEVEYCRSNEL